MATFDNISVRDTGSAKVGTVQVVLSGITCEVQLISIFDPDTQYIAKINSSGQLELASAATPLTYGITVSTGITPTAIISTDTNAKRYIVQNFSTTRTNAPVYVGGLTVAPTTGVALLDGGGNIQMDNYKGAFYAILDSGVTLPVYIRVTKFT